MAKIKSIKEYLKEKQALPVFIGLSFNYEDFIKILKENRLGKSLVGLSMTYCSIKKIPSNVPVWEYGKNGKEYFLGVEIKYSMVRDNNFFMKGKNPCMMKLGSKPLSQNVFEGNAIIGENYKGVKIEITN